ncbi:hypothetical protein B0H13DRAFT_1918333 [Mycena leptocephala]|nr:hypothetical protein B0H13DRAFT_1918333 [Mycena leptocephala]
MQAAAAIIQCAALPLPSLFPSPTAQKRPRVNAPARCKRTPPRRWFRTRPPALRQCDADGPAAFTAAPNIPARSARPCAAPLRLVLDTPPVPHRALPAPARAAPIMQAAAAIIQCAALPLPSLCPPPTTQKRPRVNAPARCKRTPPRRWFRTRPPALTWTREETGTGEVTTSIHFQLGIRPRYGNGQILRSDLSLVPISGDAAKWAWTGEFVSLSLNKKATSAPGSVSHLKNLRFAVSSRLIDPMHENARETPTDGIHWPAFTSTQDKTWVFSSVSQGFSAYQAAALNDFPGVIYSSSIANTVIAQTPTAIAAEFIRNP